MRSLKKIWFTLVWLVWRLCEAFLVCFSKAAFRGLRRGKFYD